MKTYEELEREVAALTTERDELTKSLNVALASETLSNKYEDQQRARAETAEAELDAAKRALAEMRLVVIKECECYLHSSGTGSICGLHKCDKNAALAAKSTEHGGP